MEQRWTIDDLVAESRTRLEALPPPKNGQVRAVPDERTIRYYGTIGLLDPPATYRGRTALYGPRHLAQIVAIKRMQSAGHSLADIQQMWATLDDATLTRVTGVELPVKEKAPPTAELPVKEKAPPTAELPAKENARPARRDFWKQEAAPSPSAAAPSSSAAAPSPSAAAPSSSAASPSPSAASPSRGTATPSASASPAVPASMATPAELRIELAPGSYIVVAIRDGATISPADIRALREAAAPLVTELAQRGLT